MLFVTLLIALGSYEVYILSSLVIWCSALWNSWDYGKCFTIYLVLANELCQSYFVRGSHLLPSHLPREHTVVLPHMAAPLQTFAIMTSPPFTRGVRSPVVGCESDGPQVVFNVHQLHRHDSTHPILFFTKLGTTRIYVEHSTAGHSYVSHFGALLVGQSPIHVLTGLVIASLQ